MADQGVIEKKALLNLEVNIATTLGPEPRVEMEHAAAARRVGSPRGAASGSASPCAAAGGEWRAPAAAAGDAAAEDAAAGDAPSSVP